ncbi:MAG: hypothetical protein JRG80_18210 [Deltaproteobacteria bacterium]|nr:hypothetical protein [Deltaproteobacteria bacterium]MBW2401166.1 hypothetical protein [Deltaproteobacteria bacterium]
MFSKLRGLLVTVMICALLSVPSAASAFTESGEVDERSVNIVFDALILRPIGLVVTLGGAVIYGFTAAIVGITRPKDIAKPLGPLVLAPARYTFVDPIGQH